MTDTTVLPMEAADQFRDAITKLGLTPPDEILGDGKLHRFASNGKKDDDAGWYVFYDEAIAAGALGDWRTGKSVKSWIADIGRPLSPVEKSDFQRKQQEIRIKREDDKTQRRIEVKKKASGILRYSRPASDDYPYLARKGVGAHKVAIWKDLLIVPMIDETGDVQSLQMISGDGGKKFLAGGKMQGCYFPIGSVKDSEIILIAEGYATGATVHEITGLPVIVAFNAGNLLTVAQTIRAQHPNATLILCADDDFKTEGNPGVTKAVQAAQAVGGKVIVPEFDNNRPDGATDFNDMAAHMGKDAVTIFFTSQSLEKMDDITLAPDDGSDDEQETYLANPVPAATPKNKLTTDTRVKT